MATTPESKGDGPKNIEGAAPTPVSQGELNDMLARYEKMAKSLEIKISEDSPSEDINYGKYLARKAELDVISNTPNLAPALATIDEKLAEEGLSSEVREELVGESTRLQKEALKIPENGVSSPTETSRIFIPDFAKPRGDADKTLRERTGDDLLREKEDGSQRFLLDVDKVNNEAKPILNVKLNGGQWELNKTPEGKKEDNSLDFVEYTKEDHEAIVQEYTDSIIKSNANPEDYAAELARKVEKSRDQAAMEAAAKKKEEWEIKGPIENWGEDPSFVRPVEQLTEKVLEEKTIEEKKALTEKFLTLTKESAPKVEETQEVLKNKQEQSIKKLEGMGLTRVGKALEAFKNMSSKKKLALGIALAGLSVATGGATSFVSTGLSALTFGLRDYDKEKAKAAEKGVETNKMTMLKSAVTGLVLALGTGALFHIAGDAVGAASEKLSPMIENLKHFFSPETVAAADSLSPGEVIVPVGPDVVPHSPVSTVTPDIATAPQTVTESAFSHAPDTTAPVEVVTQSAVEVPQSAPITDQYLGKIEVPPYVPSAINFGDMDYTIKAGDTYSNIMDRILPHVRGVELLDPTSKAELLKNFHEQYSSTGTFSGLSSYPDMISNIDGAKVGTEIRVDQLRGALEEEVKRRFPGNFSN